MRHRFFIITNVVVLCFVLLCGCGEQSANYAVMAEESGQSIASTEVREAGESFDAAETGEPFDAAESDEFSDAVGASEDEYEELPTKPEEISLIMVGDVLLHDRLFGEAKGENGYDFSSLFSELEEDIGGADLALVNQEVIVGGAELGVSGYPCFNAPFELGDALAAVGFDVILHATNHALDKGQKGLLSCLNFWQENYPEIAVLGIHETEEDSREIYVYEQEGIRVAILNYTYGTNGIPLPEQMPFGVDMLSKDKVIADLQLAEEIADFTIVCPHWGAEYQLKQNGEQENWAKLFAENGADLILGTHPHVIEPIVWLTKDTGGNWITVEEEPVENGVLVYYSLGNYCNWTSGTGAGVSNRMVGGMATVTLGRNENGGVIITDWGVKPLVCHVEYGQGNQKVYPLEEYTAELAEKNAILTQAPDFSLEYCRQLVQEVFGDVAE